jgi:hypothetical protein
MLWMSSCIPPVFHCFLSFLVSQRVRCTVTMTGTAPSTRAPTRVSNLLVVNVRIVLPPCAPLSPRADKPHVFDSAAAPEKVSPHT